jgi:uncharacterized membrane protein YphA (DoxX/SURF4 family)
MLVVLRLALGWHFLYEGVWKLTHHDAFLAETEGFLSVARGPAAGFFNGLVPDIDGQKRLEHDLEIVDVKDQEAGDGKPAKQSRLAARWERIRKDFVDFYQPEGAKNENSDRYKQFDAAANQVCQRHIHGLGEFVKENGDKIKAHFESFGRFNEQVKTDPSTDFMRQRRWDQLQEYRKEAKGWTADLEDREKALKADLMDLLDEHRKGEVEAVNTATQKDKLKAATAALEADLAKLPSPKKDAKPEATGFELVSGTLPHDDIAKDFNKATSPAGPKPADPPRDISAAPAKSDDVKKKSNIGPSKSQSAAKSKDKSKAKPNAKPSPAADATIVAVDFSPLAKDRDPAGPFRESRNPFTWPRMEKLTFILGYGMAAIGFCLMIGLCTRLSALAGAAFMLAVVLSQPSYPGVYPPDVPQLGHALLVNKDFVEMISLLVIASTSLGRWTGADFFLHCCCCCTGKGKGGKA